MKFADVKAEKIRLVEAADDLTKKTDRSWHVRWAEPSYPGLRIDVKIATFKWTNGEVAVNVGVVAYPRAQGTDPSNAWAMNAHGVSSNAGWQESLTNSQSRPQMQSPSLSARS